MLIAAIATLAPAAPTASDDAFAAVEDTAFTTSVSALYENDFEGVPFAGFDGDWTYLDTLENELGASHGYPVDGAGRAWNDAAFEPASSTIGIWSTGAAPLAAGAIAGFGTAATTLFGIDAAGNGENLVTTYLFRNAFTLTAEEAATAAWELRYLIDDAAVIYVNGTEVFRTPNMPAGVPTTLTNAMRALQDENVYTTVGIDLGGLLGAGVNSIAVEVHQAGIASSDAGLDVGLEPAAGGGQLVYTDDPFPGVYATAKPDNAAGEIVAGAGFGGTAAAHIRVGGAPSFQTTISAGAWRLPLTLAAAATLEVSFRYRLLFDGGYEPSEFSDLLFAVDGNFFGTGGNAYITRFRGDGNGGPDGDSGWQTFSVSVPLSAGNHELDFGLFNDKSSVQSEVTDAWFDDILIEFGGGGGVLANDTGDRATLTAALASPPASGSVAFAADGTFTYTPDADFNGADTFTYTATDTTGTSTPATVTLTVSPVNDPPAAGPYAAAVAEGGTLAIPAVFGLRTSADDVDGDSLTYALESNVSNGLLTLNADGGFDYTPDADFNGEDTFTYRADDGAEQSAPGTVTITVTPVNDPPVAFADSYLGAPGESLNVAAPGVLDGDTDSDGDSLTAQIASGADVGSVSLGAGGGFVYTPPAGFSGEATFTYRASDGVLQSPPATVTITINAAPTANTLAYTAVEDSPLSVGSVFGVLRNDSDPEGAALTAAAVTPPAHGSLSLAADGSFTYTPEADYNGADAFSYRANDGLQGSSPATVTLNITPVDDPPVAADDEYVVLIDQSVTVAADEGVLQNDSDVDGDSLSASLIADASSGTLSLSGDGAFTYTPDPGFSGTDSFTYRTNAGGETSATATVTLRVGSAANSVRINEIMFHPASEDDGEEFIELFNVSSTAVQLAGWRFTSGVTFDFPAVVIPPGGYLVIAADPLTFAATYGGGGLVIGPWVGRLSNSGERLRIEDALEREVDDITYSDQGDWAQRRAEVLRGEDGWTWENPADGGGRSLELTNDETSNKHGQNWAPSLTAPTPGAPNSSAVADAPPLVLKVKHSPGIPTSGQEVTVSADLKGAEGETLSATLHWRVSALSPGPFTATPMLDDGASGDGDPGDLRFATTVPGAPDGTVIEFYVEGSDGTQSRTWPPASDGGGGQGANALFQFDDETYSGDQPIYRLIMSVGEDDAFRFANFRSGSDAQKNTTLVARQGSDIDIRYRCGVRIRGASSRGRNPRNNRLNIPRDHPWNGVSKINLNTQFVYLQLLGSKLAASSGIEAAAAKPVQLRHNGINRANDAQISRRYGSYLHIEPIDGDWAARHYPDDPGGNIYSKGRPDVKWDVQSSGAGYRSDGWAKTSNESADDWSDLTSLFTAMNSASGPGYLPQVEPVIDHDQWARWFAYMTVVLSRETNLSNGTDDDYKFYRGLSDTRFKLVPHDFDTIFGLGDSAASPTSSIFPPITSFAGQTFPQLVPFFEDPTIARLYYGYLRNLLETNFAKVEFDATVAHCLAWVPQSVRDDIITFMDARRAHILSQIPSTFTAGSDLVQVGGVPRAEEAEVAGLSGTIDSVRTATVRVNGSPASINPFDGTWTIGGGSVVAEVLLPAGAVWRYLDDGSDQGEAWRAAAFPDQTWKSGPAELGYGGRGEVTEVGFGTDPNNKFATTYFRTTFELADPTMFSAATLRLVYDDGAAVYLNGVEILRRNLAASAPYDAFATATVVDAAFQDFALPPGVLQTGTNTVAVEIHNRTANNLDISMDAEIIGTRPPLTLTPGLNNLHVVAYDAAGNPISQSDIAVWFDTGTTTPVSAAIAAGTTWSPAAGPYLLTGDIIVPAGVTLTISPGTSVFFANGARMTVRGQLLAEGTPDQHISFAQQPGTTGGWDGVYFDSSLSDNRMAYLDQDGADSGSQSVDVNASRLVLDHVRWTGTTETVLRLNAPRLDVIGCDFPSSGGQDTIVGTSLSGADYFNLIGNVFQPSSTFNDFIDFSGARRPGPIIYVIGNVFNGGTDEGLDFTALDAHIEGNVFRNIHIDDPARGGSSNAIAADGDAHITVVRNLFADVDHALLLKNNADAIFENNTVVGATIAAINFDETNRAGVLPGRAITMRGNVFYNNAATFQNQFATGGEIDPAIIADLNILPAAHHALGSGNIDTDPLFADAAAGDYSLAPGSPAFRTGINGADIGYDIPAGASLSGEPPALTRATAATLAIHMPGISGIESGSFTTEYRWRLDGGAWSGARPVAAPISLSGLASGEHYVEVIGKDSAGRWQDEAAPTASLRWTVDPSLARLLITEILADNAGAFEHEGTFPDFIEIWNDSAAARDLTGMVLADGPDRTLGWTFPATTITAGGRLVVFANDPDGTSGLHSGFALDAEGEGVFLFDTAAAGGAPLDSIQFGFQLPGIALGRAGHAGAFAPILPSPGTASGEAVSLGSPASLVLNEWLATSGIVYDNDFLEIYNPATLPVALGGLALSDDPNNDPAAHTIAPFSYIPAGGFVKFIADNDPEQGPSHLAFSLSKLIDTVALFDADGTPIDRVGFNNGIDDTSEGRATDGAPLFAAFTIPTPGFSNGTDLSAETRVLQSLRIVELMYNPIGGSALEYVKLQNVGTAAIGLDGVQFDEGLSFAFPDTTLAPGATAFIVRDATAFAATYGGGTVLGEYSGKLDNGGERLRLEIASLSAGILDFVYDDAWYPLTDGGGAALAIIDPDGAPANWDLKASWEALTSGGGPSYSDWVTAQFGAPAAGVTGQGDDPDRDGVANLLEYVFALDPNAADPAAALPQVSVEGGFLTLTYTTAYLPADLSITPQVASSLDDWTDAGAVSVQLIADDGTLRTYKATDSMPLAAGGERFLRLRIEKP